MNDDLTRSPLMGGSAAASQRREEISVIERNDAPGVWSVEIIDTGGEGECRVTIFYGPDSRLRAERYANLVSPRSEAAERQVRREFGPCEEDAIQSVLAIVNNAVLEEREACARIALREAERLQHLCDSVTIGGRAGKWAGGVQTALLIEQRIRSRLHPAAASEPPSSGEAVDNKA